MEVVQDVLHDPKAYLEMLQNGFRELRSYAVSAPSLRRMLQFPLIASLFSTLDHHSEQPTERLLTSCDGNPILSCPQKLPGLLNPCCFNYPSGHFLLTQFWDTSPPVGPSESWTIHGLWPDRCTGGFDAFCDHFQSRTPGQIHTILDSAAESGTHSDLLSYMTRYWLSNDNQNSNLWSHEWNKHGTCVSTLEPKCYDDTVADFRPKIDPQVTDAAILDYFSHTTRLFSRLDTYSFLAAHNIIPSTSKTYTLDELETAIEASASHGFPVTLRCNQRHELDEIWYHFLVRGSLRNANSTLPHDHENYPDEIFIPTTPDGQISNCPKTGIKYLPKSHHLLPTSNPTTSANPTTTTSISSPTSVPFTGRGHLKIRILTTNSSSSPYTTDSQDTGCLIRSGRWYRSGACAVYTAQTDIIDSLSSSSSSYSTPREIEKETKKQTDQTPLIQPPIDTHPPHPPHLFTLRSSFAPCSIITPPHSSPPHLADLNPESNNLKPNSFACSPNLHTQSIFSSSSSSSSSQQPPSLSLLASSDNTNNDDDQEILLRYNNATTFYAAHIPGRFEQVEMFVDDASGTRGVRVQVVWEGVV